MNRYLKETSFALVILISGVTALSADSAYKKVGTLDINTNKASDLCDIAISPEGHFYVLDRGNSQILKYGEDGNLIKTIGKYGKENGFFNEPGALAFVGKKLWVADTKNQRIQIYSNDTFERSIEPDMPKYPAQLGVVGNRVFVTQGSIHPSRGGLVVFDDTGRLLTSHDAASHLYNDRSDIFWNLAQLVPLESGNLFVGLLFHNTVFVIDGDGQVQMRKDMKKHYAGYPEATDDGLVMPGGYCVSAFASGPKDSIFASVCDNEKRKCGQVHHFSPDLETVIGKFEVDYFVEKMVYMARKHRLAVIDKKQRVTFYEIR
ncbi:MAG: hypothetical protein QNK37_28275 [Acidobacteriota bacterium]|nr:hypothetical protein [Acidobacteriota bacterium]